MIIRNSSIGMESARTYTSVSMEARGIGTSGNVISFLDTLKNTDQKSEKPSEEESAKETFDDIFGRMKAYANSGAMEARMERDALEEIRAKCLRFLLMLLFGRTSETVDEPADVVGNTQTQVQGSITTQVSYFSEEEETSFSTKGTVVTADGRNLDFDLELTMSSSFSKYYEESFSSQPAIFTDPLVINLDCEAAQISNVKVKFDLDMDGVAEEIGSLEKGSGYVSLDLNGDGVINDGSELFGTSSGNGFIDLARYDLDGNGWIDEADEIFDKLTICFLNEDGTQELYKLKDRGIGAICLKNVSTDFSLKDLSTNETNARIRNTGIFLYENGYVGTMQNLDMAR